MVRLNRGAATNSPIFVITRMAQASNFLNKMSWIDIYQDQKSDAALTASLRNKHLEFVDVQTEGHCADHLALGIDDGQ